MYLLIVNNKIIKRFLTIDNFHKKKKAIEYSIFVSYLKRFDMIIKLDENLVKIFHHIQYHIFN